MEGLIMKRREFIRIATAVGLGWGLNAPQALAQLAQLSSGPSRDRVRREHAGLSPENAQFR